MTNQKTAVTNDGMTGGANPASSREEQSFISDERRVQDALEDDEVREVLRAFHQLPAPPISPGRG